MQAKKLSGIVPIHDEASVLERVLDSIDRLILPIDELILVFDRCDDGSELIGRGRSQKMLRVDVGNTAEAVQAGCLQASNERFVLFDGNTLVPRDYTQRLVEAHVRTGADVVSWHGGLMLLTGSTLRRFGPFSNLYLWTLEYYLRVEAAGGRVENLRGPFVRLKPSPLGRNLRYGLEYADLSSRFEISPFFRIGNKSGWIQDAVAEMGALIGHLRRGRLRRSIRGLFASLEAMQRGA